MIATPVGLVIRDAIPADLPGIQKLYLEFRNAGFNAPVTQSRAERFVADLHRFPGSALLVGVIEQTPVTTCTLIVVPNLTRQATPYALIENVATASGQQGHGYGTAIVSEAVRRAFEHGCYKVMLLTGSKEPATLRFYERAGFEQSKTGFQMRRTTVREE
ncbi:MAG: N-acetyltransferase family protein [Rhizobiaceae bacterium]